jgi:hypothetical protein
MNVVSEVIVKMEKRKVLSRNISDFTIKIYGTSEYIFNNEQIGNFVTTRELLKRSREIAFVLTPFAFFEDSINYFLSFDNVCFLCS